MIDDDHVFESGCVSACPVEGLKYGTTDDGHLGLAILQEILKVRSQQKGIGWNRHTARSNGTEKGSRKLEAIEQQQ